MPYPGGKGLLYQKLINLIPPHSTYIETHAGGAAVALNKRPARQTYLIDIDPETVATLVEIVNSGEGGHPRRNGRGPLDHTARNGDAPASSTPLDPIATFGDASARWHIIQGDAVEFLVRYSFRGDEFVYADPPYLMTTRRQQRQLYRYEYSEAQHIELLTCLAALPCRVMVSGYWSELYATMLAGWHVESYETTTRGNSPATEYVWLNYPRPVELHDYSHLGDNFRERERIKRKTTRWVRKWQQMPTLERQAILAAIASVNDAS